MLKKLTVIALILSFIPTHIFANPYYEYNSVASSYDDSYYDDSYDFYDDYYDYYTDYYDSYDTCEADPSLSDAENELNDAITDARSETRSIDSEPTSVNLNNVCLSEESFTALRTTEEESTCGEEGGLLDHLFELTLDGLHEWVSSIGLQIGTILTGGALCDEDTLSIIESHISRLRLLKRFLGLDPDSLFFRLMRRRVPAPFDDMNILYIQDKIDALQAKMDKFREKLRAECKDEEFIEAELKRLGAYDALEKLQLKLQLAQALYNSLDSIIGALEMAKTTIDYLCGNEEEVEEAVTE